MLAKTVLNVNSAMVATRASITIKSLGRQNVFLKLNVKGVIVPIFILRRKKSKISTVNFCLCLEAERPI